MLLKRFFLFFFYLSCHFDSLVLLFVIMLSICLCLLFYLLSLGGHGSGDSGYRPFWVFFLFLVAGFPLIPFSSLGGGGGPFWVNSLFLLSGWVFFPFSSLGGGGGGGP